MNDMRFYCQWSSGIHQVCQRLQRGASRRGSALERGMSTTCCCCWCCAMLRHTGIPSHIAPQLVTITAQHSSSIHTRHAVRVYHQLVWRYGATLRDWRYAGYSADYVTAPAVPGTVRAWQSCLIGCRL